MFESKGVGDLYLEMSIWKLEIQAKKKKNEDGTMALSQPAQPLRSPLPLGASEASSMLGLLLALSLSSLTSF